MQIALLILIICTLLVGALYIYGSYLFAKAVDLQIEIGKSLDLQTKQLKELNQINHDIWTLHGRIDKDLTDTRVVLEQCLHLFPNPINPLFQD